MLTPPLSELRLRHPFQPVSRSRRGPRLARGTGLSARPSLQQHRTARPKHHHSPSAVHRFPETRALSHARRDNAWSTDPRPLVPPRPLGEGRGEGHSPIQTCSRKHQYSSRSVHRFRNLHSRTTNPTRRSGSTLSPFIMGATEAAERLARSEGGGGSHYQNQGVCSVHHPTNKTLRFLAFQSKNSQSARAQHQPMGRSSESFNRDPTGSACRTAIWVAFGQNPPPETSIILAFRSKNAETALSQHQPDAPARDTTTAAIRAGRLPYLCASRSGPRPCPV
jgi:hypothetical protein